jgi:hypothetical protein
MLQLSPQENFIIARQLEDSADTNTYYIRAVIKDASNSTIKTIDLVDRGSQFFSKSWQVCPDTVGNGKWITIQTDVYDDAAYTTKSTLYGTRLDTYLVQQRVNAGITLGGGGADISYNKVREIFKEELKKLKIPEFKETDFASLTKLINSIPIEKMESSILSAIKGIKFPIQKETDLSGVILSIKETSKKIDELPSVKDVEREIKKDIALLNSNVNLAANDVRRSPAEINKIGKDIISGINKVQSEFVEKTKQELARVIPLIIVKMFQRTIEEMGSVMPEASKETVKEESPKVSKFSSLFK